MRRPQASSKSSRGICGGRRHDSGHMPTGNADLQRLTLTPKEAARVAGVDVSFVYAWVHSGELPHFYVGRSIKIPVEGLREHIKRKSGMNGRVGTAQLQR